MAEEFQQNNRFGWIERLRDFLIVYKENLLIWAGVITMIMMGGLVVWLFFFNRGEIVVISREPYVMNVVGVAIADCNQSECRVEAAAGDYRVIVSKDGFENAEIQVSVARGKETVQNVELKYIPKMEVMSDSEVVIDDSVLEEKYDLSEIDGEQFLVKLNAGIEREKIVSFPRSVEDYLLKISPDERRAVVVDRGLEMNVLYLVDLGSQSRVSIGKKPNIRGVRWIGEDELILETLDDEGGFELVVLNVNNGKFRDLPFLADINNVVFDGQKYLYVPGKVGESFSLINSFDPESGELSEFLSFEETYNFFPERMEISENKNTIRFLSDGVVYDLKLSF